MGYYAMIILVGAFLIGGMVILGMQRDTGDADLDLAAYQYEFLAREAAQTGLNATVYKLADSYKMGSWTAGTYFNNVPYKTGSFTTAVTLAPQGDTVDVVARGFSGLGTHVIFARYARDKSDKGIPPAFKHAIVSDFYMQMDGNMLIASINDSLNASIHTNSDLTVKGNTFLVEGFGTYTGTVSLNNQAADNFIPNLDYNGPDPNYHWADSVKIPPIKTDSLMSTAQTKSGTYIDMGGPTGTAYQVNGATIDFTDPNSAFWATTPNGYVCASGSCGTEENPFIMFVNGPADFLNTVQVIGHGIIIATGAVAVASQGSGGGIYGGINPNQETTVLLAALGDMQIGQSGGNACLGLGPSSYVDNAGDTRSNNHCASPSNGFSNGITLYTEGFVQFKGTPFIVGGVVARKAEFSGGGNPWITYAAPNEGIIDAGFEYIIPIGPILIAYSEF